MSSQQSTHAISSQTGKRNFLQLPDVARLDIYKLLLGGKTFDVRLIEPQESRVPRGSSQLPGETRLLECVVLLSKDEAKKKRGTKKGGKKSNRDSGGHQVNVLLANKEIYREALAALYGTHKFSITYMLHFDIFTRKPTDTGVGQPINGYDHVRRPDIEFIRDLELESAGRTPFDGALTRLGAAKGIQSLKIHVSQSDAEFWPGWLFDGLCAFLGKFGSAQRAEALSKVEFVPRSAWAYYNNGSKKKAKFHSDEADQVIRGAIASHFGMALG